MTLEDAFQKQQRIHELPFIFSDSEADGLLWWKINSEVLIHLIRMSAFENQTSQTFYKVYRKDCMKLNAGNV